MLIYKDKNFKIERVEIAETSYYPATGKAEIIYHPYANEDELKEFKVTVNELRDIKAFGTGIICPLYMYSHRSHRGWKVDGFLAGDIGDKLLKDISKIKNKVAEFNKVKLEERNAMELMEENKFNAKVEEVLDHIMAHGYHVEDSILHECSSNVLAEVIKHMSEILVNIRNIAMSATDERLMQTYEMGGI